ncbi:MAG TPA: S49 family peptidase [Verrucomicrobiae bacterium]|nr:S49 family peptidase [Verrucomicrobiae bacterium]
MDDTAFLLGSRASLMVSMLFDTQMAEHPAVKALREKLKPQMTVNDGIAQIPIEGALAYRPDAAEMLYYDVEDSRNVLDMIHTAANDKDIKGMQLNIDSPGGFTIGGFEIADEVAAARGKKPVVAHIGGMGASLAFLIASQANEVVANRASLVGSIGAYNVHIDRSRMIENAGIKVQVFKNKEAKYKAAGLYGMALNDEQQQFLTAQSQQHFDDFKSMVKSARPNVPDEAMQGQVFTGKAAKAVGLVDMVGSASYATGILKAKLR